MFLLVLVVAEGVVLAVTLVLGMVATVVVAVVAVVVVIATLSSLVALTPIAISVLILFSILPLIVWYELTVRLEGLLFHTRAVRGEKCAY